MISQNGESRVENGVSHRGGGGPGAYGTQAHKKKIQKSPFLNGKTTRVGKRQPPGEPCYQKTGPACQKERETGAGLVSPGAGARRVSEPAGGLTDKVRESWRCPLTGGGKIEN